MITLNLSKINFALLQILMYALVLLLRGFDIFPINCPFGKTLSRVWKYSQMAIYDDKMKRFELNKWKCKIFLRVSAVGLSVTVVLNGPV